MNVSSSTTAQMFQSSSSTSTKGSLSLEQQALIEDTLAKYDSSSLSESDAKEIVGIFKDAGIEPSKNFESALSSVGFDAKEIGDLAGVGGNDGSSGGPSGGRPAGGPPPPSEEDEEEIESIYDLLETLLSSDEDEESSIASTVSSSSVISGSGYDSESASFETVLDYTSKIVRLKDDAKSDVMSLIEEYNTNESNLETQESQKNLLTSLSEILKKTDNYNTMSFYA